MLSVYRVSPVLLHRGLSRDHHRSDTGALIPGDLWDAIAGTIVTAIINKFARVHAINRARIFFVFGFHDFPMIKRGAGMSPDVRHPAELATG